MKPKIELRDLIPSSPSEYAQSLHEMEVLNRFIGEQSVDAIKTGRSYIRVTRPPETTELKFGGIDQGPPCDAPQGDRGAHSDERATEPTATGDEYEWEGK